MNAALESEAVVLGRMQRAEEAPEFQRALELQLQRLVADGDAQPSVGDTFTDAAGARWRLHSLIRGQMVSLLSLADPCAEPVNVRWDEYLATLREVTP